MRQKKEVLEAMRAEITGSLTAGDELVAVGAIALEGTSRIVEKEYMSLRTYFSEGFLKQTLRLEEKCGLGKEPEKSEAWALALEYGAGALYPMGDGGIFAALWKMAETAEVGLRAEIQKIPVCQETIEICERYDLNPYKLDSKGAVLLGIRGGEALVQEYRRRGLPAAVIGQTNDGNDRLLYSGGNARYLERPGTDEIKKLF